MPFTFCKHDNIFQPDRFDQRLRTVSATTGYYAGAEDYYTKIHSVVCETTNERFSGFDFRLNESVHRAANKTYSSYLYRDEAVRLIEKHDTKDVRTRETHVQRH